MLTATDKFKDHLRASHRPLVRLGVYKPDSGGTYVFEGYLGIDDGQLTLDYRRNIRRQASVRIASLQADADAGFITTLSTRDFLETLTSTSAEITVEWGLQYPDTTTEYVTLARLRVEEFTDNSDSAVLDLSAAYDGGSRIADFGLVTPYVPYDSGGTKLTYVAAIQDLVNAAYPSATPPTWVIGSGVDTTSLPPDNTVFSGDRWNAINALAKAINVTVAPTASGSWGIDVASVVTTPVWDVDCGDAGVLVAQATAFSRREQYNAIPVRWENPAGGGGLAYVVDSDPLSPTYYDGPFGRKPRPEETLTAITTSGQATAAATTLLQQYQGITRSVNLTALHNPLLEPNDVVHLVLLDGTAEDHVIDSITLPLGGGTMSMETRILRT